jgi:hypothetical protein
MRDPRLVPETRKRIDNRDYEAVFAAGCCFHFALRLHERFDLKIRGIRVSADKSLSHVWCERKGECKGIDIRGIYPEELLAKLANGGSPATAYDVSADEVRDVIRAMDYPSELETEIFALADWIVDRHQRFEGAKPTDDKLYEEFRKNIGQS